MRPIDDAHAFVHAAELGSLSAAAKSLGVPRTTVARRIAALEERLGVPLLERTTRRQVLTRDGRRYLEGVAPLLREMDALEESIRDDALGATGTVRIAGPASTASNHVGAFLALLRARHPEIRIELVFTEGMVDPIKAAADISLMLDPLPDSSLYARRMMRADFVVVASPSYLEERGTPTSVDALLQHDALEVPVSTLAPGHWPLRDGTRCRIRPLISAPDTSVILEAAIAGFGLALLPRIIAAPAIAEGRLTTLLPEIGLDGYFRLVCARRNPPRRVAAVLDTLIEFSSAIEAQLLA